MKRIPTYPVPRLRQGLSAIPSDTVLYCTALKKGYGSIPYGARRDAKGTGHGDARRGTRRGTRQARRTAGGSVSGSLGPIERSGGSEAAEAAWAAQSGPAVTAGG